MQLLQDTGISASGSSSSDSIAVSSPLPSGVEGHVAADSLPAPALRHLGHALGKEQPWSTEFKRQLDAALQHRRTLQQGREKGNERLRLQAEQLQHKDEQLRELAEQLQLKDEQLQAQAEQLRVQAEQLQAQADAPWAEAAAGRGPADRPWPDSKQLACISIGRNQSAHASAMEQAKVDAANAPAGQGEAPKYPLQIKVHSKTCNALVSVARLLPWGPSSGTALPPSQEHSVGDTIA